MQRTKLLALAAMMLIIPTSMQAQFGDPREKFSITAEIDGSANYDHTWQAPSGDALAGGTVKPGVNASLRANIRLLKIKNLTVSLSPFYHFSNERIDDDWGHQQLGFTLPSAFHHFGSTLNMTYQLKAFGVPLTLMGIGTGNFSQRGLENSSGMLGAMFSVIRNRETHLGLGAIFLMGTSVKWPLFPIFAYSHRFNPHWSINCMAVNNYLYYHPSQQMKIGAGMELENSKHYFRPDTESLPDHAVLSRLAERFGVFADWQATKSLSFNLGAGVSVPIYGRVQESGYNKSYMDIDVPVKPFVKLKMKLSLR